MSNNVFERFNGSSINLDGRDGPVDGGQQPGEDSYSLTLQVAPAQIEPGKAATVTVRARHNGAALAGQAVSLASTETDVGLVPASVNTSTDGTAVFQIVGLDIGSTTISASMVAGGATHQAAPVTLTVSQQDPAEDYDATGYWAVTLSVESALANALMARVRRHSHQEQQRRYPQDTGLRLLSFYETADLVFMPKELL